MQQFKIPLSGIEEIHKKSQFQTILSLLMAFIIPIFILYKMQGGTGNDKYVLPVIICIVVVSLLLGYSKGKKRFVTAFETFVITVTDTMITREEMNAPSISIAVTDIREILKDKYGNLEIRSKDARRVIYVPVQIDNYTELEALLNVFKPIEAKSHIPLLHKFPILVVLLAAGLMLSVYLSMIKVVVAVAGTGFIALMARGFYLLSRSQHINVKAKKQMYWGLVVVAWIICLMVFKLTGTMGY